MKNDKSNHGNSVFSSYLISDSQTSRDSYRSQIEESTGPGFTSKFHQKWQIDFESLFTSFPSITHQHQPHSDLRHTSKYRFLKFWVKTVKSSYVFGRSKASKWSWDQKCSKMCVKVTQQSWNAVRFGSELMVRFGFDSVCRCWGPLHFCDLGLTITLRL